VNCQIRCISLFFGRTAAAVRPKKREEAVESSSRWTCFTTGARPVGSADGAWRDGSLDLLHHRHEAGGGRRMVRGEMLRSTRDGAVPKRVNP